MSKELIQFQRETVGIRKEEGGERWAVETCHTRSKELQVQLFDFVVLCTGMYNRPKIPKIPGLDTIQSGIKHSSECRQQLVSASIVKTVVVGFGKSAIDIVLPPK